MEAMAGNEMDNLFCAELTKLLRAQRHDFINHMQVIHAMLQMGRSEQAMRYIEDLAKDSRLISDALKLHHDNLAECPQRQRAEASGRDKKVYC